MEFSLDTLRNCVLAVAPVLYSLLLSVATSSDSSEVEMTSCDGVRSSKVRDPQLVSVVAILMLMVSRNQRSNIFQKIIGLWLFACSAPVHVFRVLCRIGLSIGYSSVLGVFENLSTFSIKTTRSLAAQGRFLIIFDNINRQRKFWQPSLGQHNLMMSGTASTLVELMERTPNKAFDPKPVLDAQNRRRRLSLTTQKLYDRIDQAHLGSVMALHCLNFLISHCPSISHLSSYVTEQFRTTYAIHRMPDRARTTTHPLATSNINEGSAAGCRDVLNDILLRQLKLPPAIVSSVLVIIGGDLGTIEKIRALKALESSCPHGYPTFSWVLPLVQLWHMGWADLARIINTYWGAGASSDPSSLWFSCGLLGRKLKPSARPEYYPALALVTDTLEADVLDCWRLILMTDDLDEYFSSLPQLPTGPELFELAEQLVLRWASTHAHNIATLSEEYWEGPTGSATSPNDESDSDEPMAYKQNKKRSKNNPAQQKPTRSRKKHKTVVSPDQLKGFRGDHCLANSIIRMRDSLWLFEYLYAIADGDIGRAMQVMSAWQFTFTGSGASKYATELLELACGFLYEFPPALQDALKDNWLCNLSGLPGCWFPMDLMQEHNIRELKEKSQRHDEDFNGRFFKDIVSRNIRWFTRIKSVVNKSVGLQDRSSVHGSAKKHGTAEQLRAALERNRTHYFVPGRSYGWVAQDDFMAGFTHLPDKLARFLHRSTRAGPNDDPEASNDVAEDAGDAEDTGAAPDELGGLNEQGGVPLPAMVIEGRFIAGDALDGDDPVDEVAANIYDN
ncbi:hypothetical protein FRC08_007495 [Ceratobasidium sp. 394]|nr:hypothetical protein FRC08_007495 [Ceratobasidium sp. 394]